MRFLLGLVVLVCMPLLAAAPAQAADQIVVHSAFVNVRGGVFELNTRTIFPLNEDVRATLSDGATVTFELQAVVDRKRRYWLDATLVNVILRRELSWNTVSQRYVLKDVDRGEQHTFVALDEAVVAAGMVEGWPVVVEPQLDPDATYEIRVRAGVRRGRLPDALRALVFWSEGWNRSSKWYSWLLPR
jgi:Domain of unknown function (DUF4390)